MNRDFVSASSTVVFALTDRLMTGIWECLTLNSQREIYADSILLALSIKNKRRVCPTVPNDQTLNVFVQNFFYPTTDIIEMGIDRNILFCCYEQMAHEDEQYHQAMLKTIWNEYLGRFWRKNYRDLQTALVLMGFVQRLKNFLVDRYKGLCYKLTFQSANRSTRLDPDDLYQNRRSAVQDSWGKYSLAKGAFASFVMRNITTERVYDTAINDNTLALSANHRRANVETNPRSYMHEDLTALIDSAVIEDPENDHLAEEVNLLRKIFAHLMPVHPELRTLFVVSQLKPLWLP